jgi:membrane-bound lytic murein transglycosylase D
VSAKASAEFERGRQAALSGDFDCASEHFRRAVDAVQPSGQASSPEPELLAFSIELWEGILRYEALAGPAEEAGMTDSHVAPEFSVIESPVASAGAMETARQAVASDRDGVAYDFPVVVNDAVLRVLATFQGELREIIGRGLARSGRYVPMIHRIFEEEGLPKDLAQIALIESSFIPHARSPMSAHGIWQFMPRTGRHYGLTANAVVDERRDPEKATRAAARYLAYLYELFHDWHLAMAAYNAGEGKILRAMSRTGAGDFWELAAASGAIRPQTQNYVPAVIAATLIAKNPNHYGFEIEYHAPLAYDTVTLDRPVRLDRLCDGQGITVEELKELNPELKTLVTPRQPEGYSLKIPLGSREGVQLAYAAAPTAKLPTHRFHKVRRGETLARIARRYGVSVGSLAAANSLSRKARLKRGRLLRLPDREEIRVARRPARKSKKAPAVQVAQVKKKAPAVGSYRVRRGDTLYRIALRHGTTVARILAINSLPAPTSIKPGDRLKIPHAR